MGNDCLTPGCNGLAFIAITGVRDAALCRACHDKYRMMGGEGRIEIERLIQERTRQALPGQKKLL